MSRTTKKPAANKTATKKPSTKKRARKATPAKKRGRPKGSSGIPIRATTPDQRVQTYSMTLPRDLGDALKQHAERVGVSRSEIVTVALRAFLEERQVMAAMMEIPALRVALVEAFSNREVISAMLQAVKGSPDADTEQLDLFAGQVTEAMQLVQAKQLLESRKEPTKKGK